MTKFRRRSSTVPNVRSPSNQPRNRRVKGFSRRPDEDDARDSSLRTFSLRRLVRLDSFLSTEGVRYRLLEAHRPSFGSRLFEGLLAQSGTYDLCGAPV